MTEPPSNDLSRRHFLELSGAGAAAIASGSLMTRVGHAYPADSDKTIRLAVVGGGFGSRQHWHEHPNCVVTGVTDLYPDRRAHLQKTYKCEKAYDSLETMIREAKDVDAVAVFSGAPDHARHMKMCMERGWHVVTAVPSCMTLDEAAMMKEVKERTGLKYMLHETSYYRQPAIFARNLYESGGFGELFYSEVEYYHDRGDLEKILGNKKNRIYNPDGSRSWRWGIPPMLYPTHSTGLLTGVTKERFRRVSCLGWSGARDELKNHPLVADNVYDSPFWNMSALLQTDRGNMCRCNVFWLAAAHGERAQWFGDKATLYMPKHRVHESVESVRMGATQRAAIPEYWKTDMLPPAMRHNSGHDGSHTFLSAEFINALVEDREPAVDIYEGLAMTVPGIIALESAKKNGEQLEIPQFDPA